MTRSLTTGSQFLALIAHLPVMPVNPTIDADTLTTMRLIPTRPECMSGEAGAEDLRHALEMMRQRRGLTMHTGINVYTIRGLVTPAERDRRMAEEARTAKTCDTCERHGTNAACLTHRDRF